MNNTASAFVGAVSIFGLGVVEIALYQIYGITPYLVMHGIIAFLIGILIYKS